MIGVLLGALLAAQEFTVTSEAVDRVSKEVRPLVEATTNVKLAPAPRFQLATTEDIRRLAEEQLMSDLKDVLPNPEMRRTISRPMAHTFALRVLGLFVHRTRTIHIVAGNPHASPLPRIRSADELRVVVIHELVHACDHQAYDFEARIKTLADPEAFTIWRAIVEGHAEHVTRAVLAAEKREDLFLAFEADLAGGWMSEAEAYALAAEVGDWRFEYLDGRRFFDALAASGRTTYVEDVFNRPPATKDVILHPASYYDPKAPVPDEGFAPFFREFASSYRGWGRVPFDRYHGLRGGGPGEV